MDARRLFVLGQTLQAFRAAGRAAGAETPGDSDAASRALHGLGTAQLAAGDPRAALASWRSALAMVDRLAARTHLQAARAPFFASRQQLADDAIRLLLRLGETVEAFQVADAARARVLYGLQAEARLAGLDAGQQDEWARLVAEHRQARAAYERTRDEGEVLVGPLRAAWARRRAAARADTTRLFEEAYAWLDRVAPSPKHGTLALGAVRPDEALVAYLRLDGRWHGFLVADGRIVHRVVGSPLDAWSERLRHRAHLYVVDGGWSAARSLHHGPWGDRLGISYLPRAALLARAASPSLAPPLVVADPTGDLPHARRIAGVLAGAPLVGLEAGRSAVLERLDGAAWLHFSGHGALRTGHPWDAHLRLAGGQALTLVDILTERPRLSLAVLAGCGTAATQQLAPGEHIGLAEAFLVAGARSVLATDYEVEDAAAARFVRRFYRNGGPDRPALALRSAIAESRLAGDDGWQAWRLLGRR